MKLSSGFWAALVAALAFGVAAPAASPPKLKVALTFDDLPLNGPPPAGVKKSDITRDTLKIFRKYRLPPVYGFINARALERDPDGAKALKLWIASGNPLANHTYSHINLTRNSAEDFQLEVLRNEPPLELLTPENAGPEAWRWFRYPYLHEGDTLDKRRAVRLFLETNQYRIAQTTLDHEDYLWNSAHARCFAKYDQAAIEWLRTSYLDTARDFIRFGRDTSRTVFGRDINHVFLLHLGSFSPYILPDLLDLLKAEGYEIVTLEEAQKDPIYAMDPDVASPNGGTLTELFMEARKIPWPENAPRKPRERLASICQQE